MSSYISMLNGKKRQFLARLYAGTLILHAIYLCGRVYQRGKAGTVFSGGGASKPHRSKYILVVDRFQKLPRLSLHTLLFPLCKASCRLPSASFLFQKLCGPWFHISLFFQKLHRPLAAEVCILPLFQKLHRPLAAEVCMLPLFQKLLTGRTSDSMMRKISLLIRENSWEEKDDQGLCL
jgi:hypothetical protein